MTRQCSYVEGFIEVSVLWRYSIAVWHNIVHARLRQGRKSPRRAFHARSMASLASYVHSRVTRVTRVCGWRLLSRTLLTPRRLSSSQLQGKSGAVPPPGTAASASQAEDAAHLDRVGDESRRGQEGSAQPSAASGSGFSLFRFFGVTAVVGAVGLGAMYLARPEPTQKMISDFVEYFTEPSKDKFLPDPLPMFPGGPPPMTLVLDLDETLIHSNWSRQSGWRIAKRPGLEAFLAYMSSFYEIVVFSTGLNTYADPILDRLDPNGYISHRLYRDATKYESGEHVFDLSKLNRDESRIVLVDSHAIHAKHQPGNLLLVSQWKNDPKDRTLLELIPFLESMAQENVRDVRPVLTSYAEVDNIPEEFRRRRRAGEAAGSHWGGLGAKHSSAGMQPAEKLEPPPGSLWAHLRSNRS
ncbi:Mitochondrial import inner membrane translocase subunit TIM50 [Porphyridium purpureum]|uniref:Mitochondrial import inner membrane translocase subunit TIM50 n=1 Tax=Porphyridium purpureum TaxID=35688 RepID=A0A5J4YU03_PORPP|nr:Mitochondrial import inner membrane translocase subunit TIM50 [Porphyridium purpureum]|eukprot:POR0240..scf227_4